MKLEQTHWIAMFIKIDCGPTKENKVQYLKEMEETMSSKDLNITYIMHQLSMFL
jgi:hypothetical protein